VRVARGRNSLPAQQLRENMCNRIPDLLDAVYAAPMLAVLLLGDGCGRPHTWLGGRTPDEAYYNRYRLPGAAPSI
jgi:hypothetical protein